MREPHEIENRIAAYEAVVLIIKEQMEFYEYRIKYHHHLKPYEIKQIEYTLEILGNNIDWNYATIDALKDDLDEALDKEVRGW